MRPVHGCIEHDVAAGRARQNRLGLQLHRAVIDLHVNRPHAWGVCRAAGHIEERLAADHRTSPP